MTTTNNIGAQGVSWTVFGAECLSAVYGDIITSDYTTAQVVESEVNKMRTLGNVMKWMMQDICKVHPEMAKEYIDSLESVKWENYLTEKEAEKIVSKMKPQPAFTRDEWQKWMDKLELVKSSEGHYNSCALYVTMCMKSSDSGDTLKGLLGVEAKSEKMFNAIYNLAMDSLDDEDKVFDIRHYFHLA